VWRDIGGDGTLHSLAHGGEFRLMPLFDFGHILTFARNDSPLRVLGIGDAAELQPRSASAGRFPWAICAGSPAAAHHPPCPP
jgi:hypothetical protein